MTTSQMAVTGRPAAAGGYPRRWLAAIVMIVGALMDMIDVTIVNVALPTIRRDLHASATQLEWVVSGYMLAFAAALIIAGNLGDRFGRKRVFLAGVVVFGLASLAAGLSQSGTELIAARVVQGTAAAAKGSSNTPANPPWRMSARHSSPSTGRTTGCTAQSGSPVLPT